MEQMEHFEIAILVENESGALSRISGMFTRRGFNIHSLTVGETEDPCFSRMTISAEGDETIRRQIVKQLAKLYNVKELKVMERDTSVKRELGAKWAVGVVLGQCLIAWGAAGVVRLIGVVLGLG